MHTRLTRVLLAVASVAAILTGSASAIAESEPQHIRNLQAYTASDNVQAQMLVAVNAERSKQGLAPFCTNKKLQAAAQLHSEDQAKNNFMSHTGSDGSDMSKRITAQGFKWNGIAENVAAGQKDVALVVKSWMGSSGHRANILGTYKFFGMGYAYNAGSTYKHYWTQDFGNGGTEICDSVGTVQSPVVTPAPTTPAPVATPAPTTPKPTPAPTSPIQQTSAPAPTTSAPIQQTSAPAPTTSAPSTTQSMQAQMLVAVNAERSKQGLAPFCTNKKLQAAAQLHSEDQAKNNFMSHTGSDGSDMSKRITAQGFKWNGIAENVAAGQKDVALVVKSWMGSSGHRANILGTYKFFGMGYAYNAGSTYKHYWTQDFGNGGTEVCE